MHRRPSARPPKPDFRWLARPCKRHYTFARRAGVIHQIRVRHRISKSPKTTSQDVELPGIFVELCETAVPRSGRSQQG
jgi:hypothetical protein